MAVAVFGGLYCASRKAVKKITGRGGTLCEPPAVFVCLFLPFYSWHLLSLLLLKRPCNSSGLPMPTGRHPAGGSGPIPGGTSRHFPLAKGPCHDPLLGGGLFAQCDGCSAGHAGLPDHLACGTAAADGVHVELVDGRVKANAAIVVAGTGGAVSVYASNTTNVVLDIDGYFVAPTESALAFYPLTPCRIADTRPAMVEAVRSLVEPCRISRFKASVWSARNGRRPIR